MRLYVCDLLSREVDARGDGTHTLQQSTALEADTIRASDQMDSCNIRAALQILQTSTRAPQNIQTAAEVQSFADAHEIVLIKTQCAAIQQAAAKISPPPAKLVKRMARVLCWRLNQAPAVGGMLTLRPLDAPQVDQLCCENGCARGHRQWSHRQGNNGRRPRLRHSTADRRNLDLGNICHSLAHASFAPSLQQRS